MTAPEMRAYDALRRCLVEPSPALLVNLLVLLRFLERKAQGEPAVGEEK